MRPKKLDKFKAGTCNTIDDVTGVKVKLSKTQRRWDGIVTTKLNYEERNPQDFPVTPRAQKVYIDARSESSAAEPDAYDPDTGWSSL